MSKTSFRDFHDAINGPHGGVHMSVGGDMGNIEQSPKDVLFWLHNCFIDKLWADWQVQHPGTEPDMSDLLKSDNVFKRTGNEVLSIADLGYRYD